MVATRSKTAPGPRPRPRPDLAAHPSEEELITSFLRPRVISGDGRDRPCSASFIHDADVYSAGPAALTARLAPAVESNGDSAWYFFSAVRAKTRDGQRKARTVDTGEGCWHSEAGAKPVVEGSGAGRILVGHRQGFSFVTKVDGRRVRSGWLMVELSLDGADADDVVLCKIYFSPRASASASAAESSGRKRKAAADDKNPASSARRRRRGRPTEAEAGTPTPNNDEEKDNTQQSRRGLPDENSTVTDDPDELWTDDSFFSWWMRNKDWLMEEGDIVDRTDEEIQKTYGLDEYLRLLKHHYVDFGCGHSPVLNS
ncbi:NAC domain-containing protein 18-like [Miscanthus floridulus]|uniref:NAC domain-containing protein 18-like n=1 Tax=Miscanthus floridulus TaxID=154761 RepID=UPI00345A065D